MFFALIFLFSKETVFTKFASEETTTARARHSSRRRRIPMPASPHHGARCNRHEARAGIVLYRVVSCGSAVEVLAFLRRFALSLPACTQRGTRRGAAKGSAEHLLQIQNLSNFHATQRAGPTDEISQRQPQKTSSPLAISFPACAAIVPLLDWHPACEAHDSGNPEIPNALGDDSSVSAATQQQWRACVRGMQRCIATLLTAQKSFRSFRGCEG